MSSPMLPPVAILAGGLASRIRPLTDTVPKAMLGVAGEPFIAHQLRLLRRQGAGRVTLCLGYRGEQVQSFVGDGRDYGLDVSYSYDGERLLGTGGALRKALPLLGPMFVVTYGDSYLDFEWSGLVAAFDPARADGILSVYENQGRWDTSNVVMEGDRVKVYSKKNRVREMRFIDYGAAVIKASEIARFPEGESFDLGEAYEDLAARGRLMAYEVKRRFYEIGSFQGLADLESLLGDRAAIGIQGQRGQGL